MRLLMACVILIFPSLGMPLQFGHTLNQDSIPVSCHFFGFESYLSNIFQCLMRSVIDESI
jgi:hypothetical protein